MALQERKVTCPACGRRFEEKPRLSLLGFQKFLCPKCHRKIVYPLAQRAYHFVLLLVLALVVLFALAAYSNSPWGDKILIGAISIALYVLERVSYLLFPLGVWAVLRLVGMAYRKAIPLARTILWWTGAAALVGIAIGALGIVASLIWRGVVMQPLLIALILTCFVTAVLFRDRFLRKRLQKS